MPKNVELSQFAATNEVDRTIAGEPPPDWLLPWSDVAQRTWPDILIGNGCSLAVCKEKFDYRTLLQVAAKATPPLRPEAQKMFDQLGVSDFEAVLRALSQASKISAILGLPTNSFDDYYYHVRDSLIASLSTVHPNHKDIADARLKHYNVFLGHFQSVFTTNYDLLIYWAIMVNHYEFKDYFWKDVFDSSDTELSGTVTRVLYVHGALMLRETHDGKVRKVAHTAGASLLKLLSDDLSHGRYPVFVSEGDSTAKLNSISRHTYLDFALGQFRHSKKDLLVLGHRLKQDSDQHILEAVAQSGRQRVAVGLWPEGTAKALCAERDRISDAIKTGAELEGGTKREVEFFDSRTVSCWGP